jgi:hypothetical protein
MMQCSNHSLTAFDGEQFVQAMAALLNGHAWDPSVIAPAGQAFTWCDAMFSGSKWTVAATAPLSAMVRMTVAQTSLRQLLLHNPSIASICLERCYSADPAIANNYFSVFADVAATLYNATGTTGAMMVHELLALVLTKLVDNDPGMRLRAIDVLHVLASSHWNAQSLSGVSGQLSTAPSTPLPTAAVRFLSSNAPSYHVPCCCIRVFCCCSLSFLCLVIC